MKSLLKAVASLAVVVTSMGVATPAFAAGATPTTITLTTSQPSGTVSGHAVVLRATVSPFRVGKVLATGAVTWKIYGFNRTLITCSRESTNPRSGKSVCVIAAGTLLANVSPYHVAAIYAGDANFGPSRQTLLQTITAGATTVRIMADARPTSGAPTTYTAYVRSGQGTPLLKGRVIFAVAASQSAQGVKPVCAGGDSQPLVNSGGPAYATCTLPAGWFVVPPVKNSDKHPRSRWAVSASYNGNKSFVTGTNTKRGSAGS